MVATVAFKDRPNQLEGTFIEHPLWFGPEIGILWCKSWYVPTKPCIESSY